MQTLVESVPGGIRQEICKATVTIEGFGAVDRSHLRPATPQERDIVAKAAEKQANSCFDGLFQALFEPIQEVEKAAPVEEQGNPANVCFDGLFGALYTEAQE